MVSVDCICKAFDDALDKCSDGTTSTGGIQSTTELSNKPVYNGDLDNTLLNKIADDLCERYGLEVSVKDGKREISKSRFTLWDDAHGTEIRLDTYIKRQDLIDFTNNGNGKYDLDDVMSFYNQLPDISKDKMDGLVFENSDASNHTTTYDSKYNLFNPIIITRQAFQNASFEGDAWNLQRIMFHEAGHVAEIKPLTSFEKNTLLKSSHGRNTYSREGLTTKENEALTKILNGDTHFMVSNSNQYSNAMDKNNKTYSSSYAANFFFKTMGYNNSRSEDFAEAMSMAAFRDLPDKKNACIYTPTGEIVKYDEWVKDHEYTFKLACDVIDGKIKI